MAKPKFKSEKEKNDFLLKEIIIFNDFVIQLRQALNYRELQIQKEIEIDQDTENRFNTKISELTDCLKMQKSSIEMTFNIRISEESIYHGIIPELFLNYKLKYFLSTEESRWKKINKPIQESLII